MATKLLELDFLSGLDMPPFAESQLTVLCSVHAGLSIGGASAGHTCCVQLAGYRIMMFDTLSLHEETDMAHQHVSRRRGRIWSRRYPTIRVDAQLEVLITRRCSPIMNLPSYDVRRPCIEANTLSWQHIRGTGVRLTTNNSEQGWRMMEVVTKRRDHYSATIRCICRNMFVI